MWNEDNEELRVLLSNKKLSPKGGLFKHTPLSDKIDTRGWTLMRPGLKVEMTTSRNPWLCCQLQNLHSYRGRETARLDYELTSNDKSNFCCRRHFRYIFAPSAIWQSTLRLTFLSFRLATAKTFYWHLCSKILSIGFVVFEHVQDHVWHKWTGNHQHALH